MVCNDNNEWYLRRGIPILYNVFNFSLTVTPLNFINNLLFRLSSTVMHVASKKCVSLCVRMCVRM